jgi:phosphoglycolate phosphatase
MISKPEGGLAGAAIVFDLDGTLVDTAPDLIGTLNFLLAREGVAPLALSQARAMIGQGARVLIAKGFEAAGQSLDAERLSRLFDAFIAHYRGRIAEESRPFDGVAQALDALAAAGARLGVCTNKPTDLSIALLEALGLAGRFAAIVGPDRVSAPKPSGAHLMETLALMGGTPGRAVMVGDSISDAGSARAAGAALVLVSFGYTDTPAAALGADVVIDHFDELHGACARLLE